MTTTTPTHQPLAHVSIAIFHQDGNYRHWSLAISCDPPLIYEAAGEHPDFMLRILKMRPEDDARHVTSIFVGEVRDAAVLAEMQAILEKIEMDNETTEWCCQDWVLEALERLVEEGCIDGDEMYEKGVRRAKGKWFGPVL